MYTVLSGKEAQEMTLSGVLGIHMQLLSSTETKVMTNYMAPRAVMPCTAIHTLLVVLAKTTSTIGGLIRTSKAGMTTAPTMANRTSTSSVIMAMEQTGTLMVLHTKSLERNVLIESHIKIMSSGATTTLSLEE